MKIEKEMMSKKVYIVHGYGAKIEEHWYPQVAQELRENEIEVKVLKMPKSKSPKVGGWIGTLENEIRELDEKTYLVGHSLGTITILIYLSKYLNEKKKTSKIGGIILVAPFDEDIPVFRALPRFLAHKIDYEKIKENVKLRAVIASKDDKIVPYDLSVKVVKNMDGELYSFKDKGHFGTPEGVNELPLIVEIIKKDI